ncbi:MAG: L,D-transpeptidase family protein [Clostridiales bacterium]|nr:L,D-transpeptidase family protein [Clostridiales bacterium]
MHKYRTYGLSLLLAGAMAATTVFPAFADETSTGTVISVSSPGASSDTVTGPSASAVITAGSGASGSDSSSNIYSGPGASSSSTAATTTSSPTVEAGVGVSPSGDSASSQTTTVTPETSVSTGSTDTTTTPTADSELTEAQAAELEAEQAAAAEEAANLNNPLIVPERTPHLQTTVLSLDLGDWSNPYVNNQQIEGMTSGFSGLSTFLESIHGNVLYRTYSESQGWTGWAMNGQQTANTISLVPVEAIQYRFAGPVGDQYDIYYSTILSDGTRTGWAKNGETAGSMGQGLYLTGYQLAFYKKGSAEAASLDTTNALMSAHADGVQYVDGVLQYITGTGGGYTGWGWSGNDRYYFQDSYPVTGWQYVDGYKYYFAEDGKLVSDVESLLEGDGPYLIKVNKEMNCMTIYAQDGGNGYIIPVKSFLTSVGDDTPIGTFSTPEKYRWRLMIHDVYTQYATRLGSGLSFLIHSIIYDAADPYTVWASTYNNLGIARSAGCIRLASGDAKWVYDHCPLGTTIVVYNSSVAGPFERPTIAYEIPFEQTWDPTDPNVTEEGIAAETARIMAAFNQ